jgi:hypothetical protein
VSGRVAPALRFERAVRADLVGRRWMRWHAFLLGSTCFLATWAISTALLHVGIDRLALRWPIALGAGYLVFLGLLWCWCRWLLSRQEADGDLGIDGPSSFGEARSPGIEPGGGGDFGGGGASGDFGPDVPLEAAGEGASKVMGTVLDAAGSADEGIVVVVPLAVVIGVAALIAGAIGIAVFGLFGVEVLLGVAVEIAFASASGAWAYRARREGWLGHALRRTFWPMVLLTVLVLALGITIDQFAPEARSLPHALQLLRA